MNYPQPSGPVYNDSKHLPDDKLQAQPKTEWVAIAWLFLAGCTTAIHMGKVPSALPLLREQWQLTLTQSGLIISVHALFVATAGLLLGMLVRKAGYARFAIAGVALAGFGSVLGAHAESLTWMLSARIVEGLGWIVAVIALPTLLTRLSQATDRSLVMGIWGSFVPLGAGAMLLVVPSIQRLGGWQLSWWFAGVLSLLAALLAWRTVHRFAARLAPVEPASEVTGTADLRKPVVWSLCLCFFIYSIQFISVTSFLPTLFVDTTAMSLPVASRIVAFVIMANAIGNVLAGVFLRRGVSYVPLLIAGALGSALCALIIFSGAVPSALRLLSAFGFSAFAGLIPGTLFATLPRAASSVSAAGLLVGLMMQWSGMGQLVGGIVLPGAVDYFERWEAAGMVAMVAGVVSALLAWRSRRQSFTG